MTSRVFLSWLLSLALALASVSMAVARADALGQSRVTLCSGSDVISITLDAEGEPARPPHLCPDCIGGLSLGLPPTVQVFHRVAGQAVRAPLPLAQASGAGETQIPQARGPPFFV